MKKNVGTLDQKIRFIVGLLFLILFFSNTVKGNWGLALVIVGGILVLTSVIKICPVYSIFGVSTCAISKISTIGNINEIK